MAYIRRADRRAHGHRTASRLPFIEVMSNSCSTTLSPVRIVQSTCPLMLFELQSVLGYELCRNSGLQHAHVCGHWCRHNCTAYLRLWPVLCCRPDQCRALNPSRAFNCHRVELSKNRGRLNYWLNVERTRLRIGTNSQTRDILEWMKSRLRGPCRDDIDFINIMPLKFNARTTT